MASNPKLLSYIEDKIKALIETRVQKLSELEVDDALSDTSENPVQNKVIKAALDDKLGIADIDDALSTTSENPVQNKVIKAAIDAIPGGGGTVDTAMSNTSENAVQNKVIKAYVDGQAVTVDSAFSSSSENPVQNKVIFNEFDLIKTHSSGSVVWNITNVIGDSTRKQWNKVGRIVIASIEFTPVSGKIANNNVICSGLPIPSYPAVFGIKEQQMIIKTSGDLAWYFPTDTTTLSRIDITLVYFTSWQ